MHEAKLSVKRMTNLQLGETLVFDAKPDSTVTLRCGDFHLTEGRVGRVGERVAVQIVRPLRRSRTTMASFDVVAPNS